MGAMARVTSKSRVSVPKSVRDALGIAEGDTIVFRVEGDRVVLTKLPDFLSLAGSISVPPEKQGMTWDQIKEETWRERAKRWT